MAGELKLLCIKSLTLVFHNGDKKPKLMKFKKGREYIIPYRLGALGILYFKRKKRTVRVSSDRLITHFDKIEHFR